MMIRNPMVNAITAPLPGSFLMASLILAVAMCGAVAAERSGGTATPERLPQSPSRAASPATPAPSRPFPGPTPIVNPPAPPSAPIVTPSLKFIGAGPLGATGGATTIGAGVAAPIAAPTGASKSIATGQLRFIGVGK